MTAPAQHESIYRNTALLLGGLMGAIALLVAAVAAALNLAANGDQLMHMVFAALGLFVLAFAVCMLLALRRHRWTIEPGAVRIEERPLVPFTGRRRNTTVPFAAVAALGRVQNIREDFLALTTREGRRFVLSPKLLPGEGPKGIRYPDQPGLEAFAERLRAAMHAAGFAAPPVADALGFWNRAPGLALLGVTFLASLGLAALAIWAMFEGAGTGGARSGEAVGLLAMLPIGLGWLLRNVWRRRRAVLRELR
jgi:hypothetical protein